MSTLAHYNKLRERRINETDINQVDIYRAMLRIASRKYEAMQMAVMLESVEARPAGIYVVSLCLLNADLKKSNFINRGSMRDGLWTPARDDPFEVAPPVNGVVTEGYLVDYDDGMGLDMLLARESQQLQSVG